MGTSYLVDSHVLIWMTSTVAPRSDVELILRGDDVRLVVSAASAFEISLKVRVGRLDMARPLVAGWTAALEKMGVGELDVTAEHALAAGSLEWPHRDPFDRLLVAQAKVERLTLVTADRRMLDAPGVDVLPW
jgi:PIN domain nuclease of toxin-antitoxin system